MIPEFDDNGNLPPGIHLAGWGEFVRRFAGTPRRKLLLIGLRKALENLRDAGCHTAYTNGSFVTTKDEPGDFDLCWEGDGVDLDKLDPVILDLEPPRSAQKIKYGGDILPNARVTQSGKMLLEFFQTDRSYFAKGIVKLDLRGLR